MPKNVLGQADHLDPAADARQRAFRTFVQGLVIDVAVALALLVQDTALDESTSWKLLAISAAKTVLTATASYVMRVLRPPVGGA